MRHADITDSIVVVTYCADKPALSRDAYLVLEPLAFWNGF